MVDFIESPLEIRRYLKIFLSRKLSHRWFIEQLYKQTGKLCPRCKQKMNTICKNEIIRKFRCQKCKKECSVTHGTAFFHSKVNLHFSLLSLLLIYIGLPQNFIVYFTGLSRFYISNLQVMARYYYLCNLKNVNIVIGGEGKRVQIDEAIIRKRKYHRGRKKEQIWIFGAIEEGGERGNDLIIKVVPSRKSEVLIPLIKKIIAPGTTIISDDWKAYSNLEQLGYHHLTVNHSKNFTDPITGANTNLIEGLWAHLRKSFPKSGIRKKYISDHIARYILRRGRLYTFTEFIEGIAFINMKTMSNFYKERDNLFRNENKTNKIKNDEDISYSNLQDDSDNEWIENGNNVGNNNGTVDSDTDMLELYNAPPTIDVIKESDSSSSSYKESGESSSDYISE